MGLIRPWAAAIAGAIALTLTLAGGARGEVQSAPPRVSAPTDDEVAGLRSERINSAPQGAALVFRADRGARFAEVLWGEAITVAVAAADARIARTAASVLVAITTSVTPAHNPAGLAALGARAVTAHVSGDGAALTLRFADDAFIALEPYHEELSITLARGLFHEAAGANTTTFGSSDDVEICTNSADHVTLSAAGHTDGAYTDDAVCASDFMVTLSAEVPEVHYAGALRLQLGIAAVVVAVASFCVRGGVGAGAGTSIGTPSAMAIGLLALVMSTTRCPGEAPCGAALTGVLNPLHLDVGGGASASHGSRNGAAIGAAAILAGLSIIGGLTAAYISYRARGLRLRDVARAGDMAYDRIMQEADRRLLMVLSRFDWLCVPAALLYCGGASGALGASAHSDGPHRAAGVLVVLAYVLGLPYYTAATADACVRFCQYRTAPAAPAVSTAAAGGTSLCDCLRVPLHSIYMWEGRGGVRGAKAWHALHHRVYGPYQPRYRYTLTFQLCMAALLAGLGSIWLPRRHDECWARAMATCLILGAWTAYLAVARPYIAPYANVLEASASAAMFGTSVGTLLAIRAQNPSHHWGSYAAGACAVVALCLTVVRFLLDVGVALFAGAGAGVPRTRFCTAARRRFKRLRRALADDCISPDDEGRRAVELDVVSEASSDVPTASPIAARPTDDTDASSSETESCAEGLPYPVDMPAGHVVPMPVSPSSEAAMSLLLRASTSRFDANASPSAMFRPLPAMLAGSICAAGESQSLSQSQYEPVPIPPALRPRGSADSSPPQPHIVEGDDLNGSRCRRGTISNRLRQLSSQGVSTEHTTVSSLDVRPAPSLQALRVEVVDDDGETASCVSWGDIDRGTGDDSTANVASPAMTMLLRSPVLAAADSSAGALLSPEGAALQRRGSTLRAPDVAGRRKILPTLHVGTPARRGSRATAQGPRTAATASPRQSLTARLSVTGLAPPAPLPPTTGAAGATPPVVPLSASMLGSAPGAGASPRSFDGGTGGGSTDVLHTRAPAPAGDRRGTLAEARHTSDPLLASTHAYAASMLKATPRRSSLPLLSNTTTLAGSPAARASLTTPPLPPHAPRRSLVGTAGGGASPKQGMAHIAGVGRSTASLDSSQ